MEKLGVYVVFDNVSRSVLVTASSATDGTFVRENLIALARVNANVFTDLTVYKVATLDRTTMAIEPIGVPQPVSWDSYKFPESVINSIQNPKVVPVSTKKESK